MGNEKFVCVAQMNSTRAVYQRLGLRGMLDVVRRAVETARIDVLILGGEEIPELFWALSGPNRPAQQVYLWYAALADHPNLDPDFRVINYRGEASSGWQDGLTGEEVEENFIFACPNHPGTRTAVFTGVESQLGEYPWDGLFLDKIRYPSPANGLDEVFSCFCPYCQSAAADVGLDLGKVRSVLECLPREARHVSPAAGGRPQTGWESCLGSLAGDDLDLLIRTLAFRAGSITRLTGDVRALTNRLGVRLGLDLFSPGLAYLVGQDYPALARIADWVKPMTYRYANGPAGLRLEIPRLVRGLEDWLGLPPGTGEAWMQARAVGLAGISLAEIERSGPPLEFVAAETRQAVEMMGDRPVLLGVEAVSMPAFNLMVEPEHVRTMLALANASRAGGIVLSWDLLEMPFENLQAAGER